MTSGYGNQATADLATAGGDTAAATTPVFRLCGALRPLHAAGCGQHLPAGSAATLGDRVSAFFNAADVPSRPLVGLLPFNPQDDDALYQPQRLLQPAPATATRPPQVMRRTLMRAQPGANDWAASVARCVEQLAPRSGDPAALHKVVLARSLHIQTDAAIDVSNLLQQLTRDTSVTAYAAHIPVTAGETPAWLVGATPELLLSRRGTDITSNPLAGSALRCADKAADDAAAQALLTSSKDQDEHRYVVEAIADTLAPFCTQLRVPTTPSLQATRSLWHLGTRIEGRLRDNSVSAARLAAALHPTPAVCGTPTPAALQMIQTLESIDRGFYAGAVGWVDAVGDGDWYLALRCARVQGSTMRLFAGAGIVADSQPQLEVAETAAKFRAMLDALGIDYTDYS